MSDYKPNEHQNTSEDLEALLQLLERLNKRDDLRRYVEQLAKEEAAAQATPQETVRREAVRYQPTELTAVDARDLLLTEDEEASHQPARTRPAEDAVVDARDLLFTNMEDPLKMSEYLINGPDEEGEEDEDGLLPLRPRERRNPFKALWLGFCGNLPRKEDPTRTKVRKYGFLFSLLVMLVAAIYLVVDLLIIPAKNEKLKEELIALYHPEKAEVVVTPEEAEKNHYPENMLASFTELYDRNDEVRGWISYHADGKKDFLEIDYPIVYSGDNTKYLKKDFDGNKNRNGTLFFDQNNQVNTYEDRNHALIVYGHNMASGQMFAGLNKLMGNLNNARAAATFTMSTLFRQDQYKVFAVVLIDESDRNERSYNMWKTQFSNNAEFRNHIEEIRARSMFDYTEVEVNADDQIVVLSTCTGKSSAHVKDGRLLVVARRVRDGESATVDTSTIVKNTDVIMPYYWYINQNKTVHEYYTENGLTTNPVQSSGGNATGYLPTAPATSTRPGQSTTTGTGSGSESTTATTGGSGTTNAAGTTTASKPTQSATPGSSTAPGSSTTTGSSTAASSATQSSGTPTEPTKPVCEHQYDNDCDTTCNVEGCGYVRETTHVYDNCDDTQCNVCQAERTAVEHTYDNACDKECNVCKEMREVEDHHYGDAVTVEPTCGEDGSVKKSCTECGYTYTVEPLPATGEHVYDDDNDVECNVCRYERELTPEDPKPDE